MNEFHGEFLTEFLVSWRTYHTPWAENHWKSSSGQAHSFEDD